MPGEPEDLSPLSKVRQRLEHWRQRYGGAGRRIPEELWAEAIEVARVEGVAATARALRVDRWGLERRMELPLAPAPASVASRVERDATSPFVELNAVAGSIWSSGQTVLRFEGTDGERLQIAVTGVTPTVDVVGLAEAFWRRRR